MHSYARFLNGIVGLGFILGQFIFLDASYGLDKETETNLIELLDQGNGLYDFCHSNTFEAVLQSNLGHEAFNKTLAKDDPEVIDELRQELGKWHLSNNLNEVRELIPYFAVGFIDNNDYVVPRRESILSQLPYRCRYLIHNDVTFEDNYHDTISELKNLQESYEHYSGDFQKYEYETGKNLGKFAFNYIRAVVELHLINQLEVIFHSEKLRFGLSEIRTNPLALEFTDKNKRFNSLLERKAKIYEEYPILLERNRYSAEYKGPRLSTRDFSRNLFGILYFESKLDPVRPIVPHHPIQNVDQERSFSSRTFVQTKNFFEALTFGTIRVAKQTAIDLDRSLLNHNEKLRKHLGTNQFNDELVNMIYDDIKDWNDYHFSLSNKRFYNYIEGAKKELPHEKRTVVNGKEEFDLAKPQWDPYHRRLIASWQFFLNTNYSSFLNTFTKQALQNFERRQKAFKATQTIARDMLVRVGRANRKICSKKRPRELDFLVTNSKSLTSYLDSETRPLHRPEILASLYKLCKAKHRLHFSKYNFLLD